MMVTLHRVFRLHHCDKLERYGRFEGTSIL